MRDVFLPIRQAYYQVLNNAIEIGGKTVPFYDVVPKNYSVPYILVRQQNEVIKTQNSCYESDAFIMLEIVTKYESYKGGRKDADTIADGIFSLLASELPQTSGMYIGQTYKDTDFDQGREMNDTIVTNRRFIQFKNSVSIL